MTRAKALGGDSRKRFLEVYAFPPGLQQLDPHEIDVVVCMHS